MGCGCFDPSVRSIIRTPKPKPAPRTQQPEDAPRADREQPCEFCGKSPRMPGSVACEPCVNDSIRMRQEAVR